MAWLDFIKAIRQDEDEEEKRRQQEGFGGWWGDVQNSWDNLLDVGSSAIRGDFGGAVEQGKQYLGDVGSTLGGIKEAGEDILQGTARGVVNIGMTLDEASRNSNIDSRNKRIDQILEMPKEERERLASIFDDPEKANSLSDEEWSKAFILKSARKELGGDLSDEALKKRKEENEAEKQKHNEWTPGNDFTKFIFGGEEGETAQSAQKTSADASKFLEERGIEGAANQQLSGAFGLGMLALDLPTGGGTIVKNIGKGGVKELVKAGTDDAVEQILRKQVPGATDEMVQALTPQLRNATDEKQVTKILDDFAEASKQAPAPTSVVDDVVDTAPAPGAVTPPAGPTLRTGEDVINPGGAAPGPGGVVPPATPPKPPKDGYGDAADELLGRMKSSDEIAEATKKTKRETFEEQYLDRLAPINRFVKQVEGRLGRKLATEENMYERMRLYSGMSDVVQQRVEQLTDVLKQSPDLDAVRVIGTARQVLGRSDREIGSMVSRETAEKAINQVREKLGNEAFEKAARVVDEVTAYNKQLLKELHEAGEISDDAMRAIEDVGADYFSRFNVVEYVTRNDANRSLFARGGSYNETKQALKKVLGKAKGMEEGTEILDPIEAIVISTDRAMRSVNRNKIWQTFYDKADDVPDLIVKIKDPENIAERISLAQNSRELRPIRNKLDRMLKTRGQGVRRLQSEINRLEKKGLNLSLKKGGQRMDQTPFSVQGLGGDLPTSQTGRNTTDFVAAADGTVVRDPAKQIDSLSRRRDDMLRKAEEAMPEDVPGATLPRPISDFQEAVTIRGKADAAQKKIKDIVKDGPAKAMDSATTGSKLGQGDTNAFLRNLIENGSRSDIDKIKKMVGNRDAKLTSLLDEIGEMKSQYDDIAGTIRENAAKAAELADEQVPEGFQMITGFRNGIEGKIAVPKEVAEVYMGKTSAQQDYMTGVMGNVHAFVKQNLTANSPAFALITNPIRDAKTFAYNSRNVKSNPFALSGAYFKGLFGRLMRDSDYQRMIEVGGKSGFYADERTGAKIAEEVARKVGSKRSVKSLGFKTLPINSPKDFVKEMSRVAVAPLRGARDRLHGVASVLEDAPRVAEFKAAKKAGKTDLAAAFDARDVTVDFQQMGQHGQILNAWVPFLNARAQGTLKSAKAIKRNPARAASVYATLTAAPIIAAALNNERFPEVMKMIPDDERDNNFVIVLGDGKDESGRYNQVITIPKSDVDKILGNPLENIARWMSQDDPKGLAEVLTNMVGSTLPVDLVKDGEFNTSRAVGSTLLASPVAKIPAEYITGHNFYFDSPQMSQYMETLPENEQRRADDPYTEEVERGTSPVADFVASLFGGSPIKTENALRGAGFGFFLDTPDKAMGNKLVGVSDNKMNNEFYRILKKTSPNKNSASRYINEAIERGDYQSAYAAADSYNAYLREQFQEFAQNYGQTMTPELAKAYEDQKIVLNSRSLGQRRRNILERQAGR